MLKQSSGFSADNGSYIFISYAREDSNKVEKFLQGLEEQNYRFWYDAGLKPGHQWTKDLAEKIENCECFFAMISKDYVQSAYCETELGLALMHKRFIVPVYLEKTELPGSFYLQIGKTQYLRLDEEKDGIWKKLEITEEIQKCRDISPTQGSESHLSSSGNGHQSGLKRFVPIAVITLLLAAAGVFLYFRWIKPETVQNPNAAVLTEAPELSASSMPAETGEAVIRSLVLQYNKKKWTTKLDHITIDSDKSDTPWLPNVLILHLNRADSGSIPDKIILKGKLNETDEYQDLITIPSKYLENDHTDGNALLLYLNGYSEETKKNVYFFFRLDVFLKDNSDSVEVDWAELQQR